MILTAVPLRQKLIVARGFVAVNSQIGIRHNIRSKYAESQILGCDCASRPDVTFYDTRPGIAISDGFAFVNL